MGAGVVGLLLGGWFSGTSYAQPFSAQIQRALNAFRANPVFTGPVKAPSGTAGAPGWTFAADPLTGCYLIATSNVGCTAAGVLRWDWNTTRILSTIPFQGGDGSAASPTFNMGTKGMYSPGGNAVYFSVNSAARMGLIDDDLSVRSAGSFSFSSGAIGAATDVSLFRDAANILAQRNGTNAQIARFYNTYTSASDYERGAFGWVGSEWYISTQAAGSGQTRAMVFQTGGIDRWSISTTGHWLARTDNTYDIGASGATRPRTGYFGTSVVSPILQGSGTGTSVANVGANSCGTTAATIAGNQLSGVITVGATAGTQCRVTFSTAAPVARDCTVTDSTTTIATRATVVDTTNTDFLGAFVAGDKITYQCTVR